MHYFNVFTVIVFFCFFFGLLFLCDWYECVYECAWYHKTFFVYLSLSNKVVLYNILLSGSAIHDFLQWSGVRDTFRDRLYVTLSLVKYAKLAKLKFET